METSIQIQFPQPPAETFIWMEFSIQNSYDQLSVN